MKLHIFWAKLWRLKVDGDLLQLKKMLKEVL